VAQLNSASDYGSEGYWFESSRGHKNKLKTRFYRVFSFDTFQFKRKFYIWQKEIMPSDYQFDKTFYNQIFEKDSVRYHEFEQCTFHDCDFSACDFTGVIFIECSFFDCNFKETRINYVSLRDVQFTKCNFTSVNFAMTDQVIYSFNFTDCLLDYAQFYNLKLKKIQFINCSMIAVDFMNTDLSEALFDNCNLRRAVFMDSNLQKADFYTSYEFVIDPEKNKMKRAIFSAEGLKGLLSKYDLIIK